MSQKILDGLNCIGYGGPLLDKEQLDHAIEEGPKNVEFTKLVNYLSNELRIVLNLDEEINAISSPEDSIAFVMEVSSFLKELNCCYTNLTQGHISDRLQNHADKILLLDYLSTELMAARILQQKKPDKKLELKLQETVEAANMRKILMSLRFPKPPPNITIPQLFQKVCPTIEKAGKDVIGKPAFTGKLSDKQWEILNGVQTDLHLEYKIRREMLLTRLDVTIQSFQWSDKTKGKDEQFEKIYTEKRKKLKTEPDVELADLLAAREDIAIIEKTSNSNVRKNTKSSLNKVIIGQVPDRGGRTSEQAPPPPEMPSWQQRTAPSSGGRGGGRGGGNYQRNTGNYSGGNNSNQAYNQNRNFDSAGSYNTNYNKSSFDNRSFDSSGSYSRDYNYEQHSKRPKTYDNYQTNRTTYADQYVEEEQHNRQYQGRGGYRGRGRGNSNYHRGGRGRNYY